MRKTGIFLQLFFSRKLISSKKDLKKKAIKLSKGELSKLFSLPSSFDNGIWIDLTHVCVYLSLIILSFIVKNV